MLFQNIIEKVKEQSGLQELRQANPEKKIVFCTGCYDIIQSGHAVFFNQCKEFGDILVVGVGRDEIITRLKGTGRPVNGENNRIHCNDTNNVLKAMKEKFSDCFELQFNFHFENIKELNRI